MEFCAERGFKLIEKMAFERVSGSPEEKKAADILFEAAKAAGGECEIDPFQVEDGVVRSATLEILEPYQASYRVNGYIRSLSTPKEGITADFLYVENGLPVNLENARGKIVLVNNRVTMKLYERLQKAQVAAIVSISGSLLDREDDSDLDIHKLRPMLTEAHGNAVAVNVHVKDAMDMVRRHASKARVCVDSENVTRTSHNVYATVKGVKRPDEIIALGAHYDSVLFSTGVYDNAAGSAVLMELLHHFAAHPPRRTLRFMWYGSEEQGLLGSKHYVATHPEEMKKTRLMINVDIGAPVLGYEVVKVTGQQSAADYISGLMQEAGLAVDVQQDIYSSDSIPFADQGIAGFNFLRSGAPGASFIHNRHDRLFFLSAEGLASTIRVAGLFTDKVANGCVMPVQTDIPEEIRDKVDKYLFKKK